MKDFVVKFQILMRLKLILFRIHQQSSSNKHNFHPLFATEMMKLHSKHLRLCPGNKLQSEALQTLVDSLFLLIEFVHLINFSCKFLTSRKELVEIYMFFSNYDSSKCEMNEKVSKKLHFEKAVKKIRHYAEYESMDLIYVNVASIRMMKNQSFTYFSFFLIIRIDFEDPSTTRTGNLAKSAVLAALEEEERERSAQKPGEFTKLLNEWAFLQLF